MNSFFIVLWTVVLFLSIGWYALLLFVIGAKAGREIRQMTRALRAQREVEKKD